MFTIAHFTFDGEQLGRTQIDPNKLSQKWLEICAKPLNFNGPIFTEQLNGSLNHYEIECVAGVVKFLVFNNLAFMGVLLSASNEKQNESLIQTFLAQLNQIENSENLVKNLTQDKARPLFFVINFLNLEIPEQDQEAMFQLAYHFAATYFSWRSA